MEAKNISQDSQHKENSEGSTMSALKEKVILETVENLKKHSLHSPDAFWSTAFIRHKGFFTNKEQGILRFSTVAIAGLGAVGGTVFLDLVRAGVGSFVIADFDSFEPSNLNRQNGARPSTFGRKKIEVLVEEALQINPYITIQTFSEGLTASTIPQFLKSADIVIDAMDFFAYKERLTLLLKCREKGLFVISSGNAGFGASLLVFDPHGMDIQKFLGVSLHSSNEDVMAAFALAWIPRQVSSSYTDPSYISLESKVAPATGVAALLAGAMIITEALRLLLHQNGSKPIPHFVQIDIHEGTFIQSVLRFGNRSVWQRIRRYVLINHYWGKKKGFKPVPPPGLPQERVMQLPVPDLVLRAILTAGIQAPSGDNIQPWLFKVVGDVVYLSINETIDVSYFNYRQIPSFISAGAVLENIKIAASSYGLTTVIEYADVVSVSNLAKISFKLSDLPRDTLFNAIWERNTNRRKYNNQQIPEHIRSELKKTAESFPGVVWHEVSLHKSRALLARAVYLVDIIRSERKDLHVHIQKMLRFTQKSVYQKKDGFPLRNLKAGFFGEMFLTFTHPWKIMKVLNIFGFSRIVARFVYDEIISAPTVVLLTAPTCNAVDAIVLGQALERVWLKATDYDLAFQPMAGPPMFLLRNELNDIGNLSPRHKKILDEAAALEKICFPDFNSDNEKQLMLFRVGYSKPIEVGTLRKPLDSFII